MEIASGHQFRRELRQRVAKLEDELATARSVLAGLDQLLGQQDDEVAPYGVSVAPPLSPSAPAAPVKPKTWAGGGASKPLVSPAKQETRWDRIDRLMEKSGGRATIRELVRGLTEMGDVPTDSDARFYNVVDSAMRTGEKRGRYRRTGKPAEWELVPDDPDLFPGHESNSGRKIEE